MGRKKSASVLKPFSAMYPAQSCNALDRIGEANVCPRKNLVMGKMQFMNYKQDQWFALIYWVAYEILPVVDIHRPPYTQKKIKDTRKFGSFVFHLLQLCKACFEHDEGFARRNGSNPWDYWVKCVLEIKAFYFSHKVKDKKDLVQRVRYFYRDLERGDLPSLLINNPKFKYNLKLCKTAQLIRSELPKQNNLFMNDWNSFLTSCHIVTDEFRSNGTKLISFNKDGRMLEKYKNICKPAELPFADLPEPLADLPNNLKSILPDNLKSVKVTGFNFNKRTWSEHTAYPRSDH
jgi:hypothetical protein